MLVTDLSLNVTAWVLLLRLCFMISRRQGMTRMGEKEHRYCWCSFIPESQRRSSPAGSTRQTPNPLIGSKTSIYATSKLYEI